MDRDPRTAWSDDEPADAAAADLFRPVRAGSAEAACPPADLVQAARAGVLPHPLQDRVAAHVDRCAVCQALGGALDDASVGSMTAEERERILVRIRHDVGGAKPAWLRFRRWRPAAVAAGLMLVAAALLTWHFRDTNAPETALQVAASRTPSVFRLEKPGTRGRAEILLRWSAKPGEAEDLTRALEPYRTDDFGEVARRLTALVKRHPESAAGYFYLGVSQMFLDRNAEAVTALQAAERLAKDDPNLAREVAWYLAMAYHRTGQSGRSTAGLESLCGSRGPRAGMACVALRELAGPLTLSGVVRAADGVALAGARVSEWTVRLGTDFNVAFPTGLSATTDSTGRYSVTGSPVSGTPLITLRVARPGYFTTARSQGSFRDTQIDFVVEPWTFITLGEDVRRTVQLDDAVCGEPNERCHHFALTVPAAGTLEASLDSPTPGQYWDLHVETPAEEAYGPPMGASFPLRVTIPVDARSTYEIRVVCISDTPHEYTLTTRLR